MWVGFGGGVSENVAPASAPAGWYTDPLDATGRRWWTGAAWTEQTWQADVVAPERPRFSAGSASAAVADAYGSGPFKDPYRVRNPIPMIALVFAGVGLIVILLSFVVPMPMLFTLLASGGTGGFGTLALVSAIRLGAGMRIAVIALAIGAVDLLLSFAGGGLGV